MKTENILEIKRLVGTLNKYRNAYYNQSESIVPDAEYDFMFDELQKLENATGIVLSNSPTRTVGFDVMSKLEKIQHDIPLLSLSKTKNINDLGKFVEENPCLLMLKYDGLTVELVYHGGKLIQASTRGDGHIGENITHNAQTFKNIPITIPYKGFLRLAGEAIIYKDDFQLINESLPIGEKPYANARNLAAGSVRQLNSGICSTRNVHWILWDVLEGLDETTKDSDSRLSKFLTCKELGFDMPNCCIFKSKDTTASQISKAIDCFKRDAIKNGLPIDGLVLKYDSYAYSKKKGGTSHHNNDGIAFKFKDETADTVLRAIEWSLGRTGQFTPVAIFDPIELDGTIVSRASIHNLNYLRDYDLNIGDNIRIYKANMIIPQILKNLSAEKRDIKLGVITPTLCPVCGGVLKIEHVNNTDSIYCINPHCSGKKLSAFKHFVSKSAINIDGLSEAALERFMNNGWLKEFSDIYKLNEHRDEIVRMDGFGERSYEKMWNTIDDSRNVSFDKFLVSLGIPTIGKTASKAIAKFCKYSISKFEDLIRQGFDWSELNDFGQTTSDNIKCWFNDPYNVEIFAHLLDCLTIKQQEMQSLDDARFADRTVVVTGTFQHFTRNQLIEKLEELGAKVSGSVSKKTDYLIAGEKAGSKLAKAQQLEVEILTENELVQMVS